MDEENVVVNEAEVSADIATDEGPIEESKVESQEVQEEIAEPEDDTPFPKKAVNAISRREKKIEKLRAELEQVKAQLQQGTSKEPVIEKRTSEEKQSESYRKEKDYYDQRVKDFDSKEDEYLGKFPDFEKLSNQFTQEVAENLSVDVRKAILESEDGPLALYTLMKEGRIDELEDMDGRQALRFLAKAEMRGQKYIENSRKVSAAPKPIQAVKGTGTYKKDVFEMTPDEIRKKYNLR